MDRAFEEFNDKFERALAAVSEGSVGEVELDASHSDEHDEVEVTISCAIRKHPAPYSPGKQAEVNVHINGEVDEEGEDS